MDTCARDASLRDSRGTLATYELSDEAFYGLRRVLYDDDPVRLIGFGYPERVYILTRLDKDTRGQVQVALRQVAAASAHPSAQTVDFRGWRLIGV